MTTPASPLQSQPDPMVAAFQSRSQATAPAQDASMTAPAGGPDPMVAAFQSRATNKAGGGSTIGPQQSTSAQADPATAKDPFERAGRQMTGGFARLLMDATDKLRDVENFTEEGKQAHPVQAFLGHIANRIEGLTFGNEQHPGEGIGTGQYGMLNNPVTSSLLPGKGGTPMLAEAAEGAANLAKKGVAALKGDGEGAGIVKQALKGKGMAQEPAKAAVRGATGAEEGSALLEGNKSIVDKPIQDLFGKERAAYAKQDKIAGFDMKALHDKLESTEEQIRNLTDTEEDVAKEAKLEKARTATMDKISEAEGKLKEAGVDPEEAKGIFQQRKAAEDFKKAIVQHTSADSQSVNVDGLLESAKKLRFNKYGDRLEQFLGSKEQADQFMQKLQDAQKLGAHAMKVQRVAKWLGGIAGIGAVGGAIHAAKELVQ